MQIAAVESVRCVEGCGGGTETLGIIGLVVAFLSLAVALKAWKVSDASLGIAREEHREFLRQLRARADFELHVEVDQYRDETPIIETTEPAGQVIWKVAITNTGDKGADRVGLRFYAPDDLDHLSWGTERMRHKWGEATRITSAEILRATDGSEYGTTSIEHEIDRIGVGQTVILFAGAIVKTPDRGAERALPVRLLAYSEDLPDDVELRDARRELILRRLPDS